eukprot:2222873-Prymnesium_polylepis.1
MRRKRTAAARSCIPPRAPPSPPQACSLDVNSSLGALQRTPFPANDKAMSNEGLGATNVYALCERCSCEGAELSAARTIIDSMPPADQRASELLTQPAHTIRRCKAGGRRPA